MENVMISRENLFKLSLGGAAFIIFNDALRKMSSLKNIEVQIDEELGDFLSAESVDKCFKDIVSSRNIDIERLFLSVENTTVIKSMIILDNSMKILSVFWNDIDVPIVQKEPEFDVKDFSYDDVLNLAREYDSVVNLDRKEELESLLGQIRYYHQYFFDKNALNILRDSLDSLIKGIGCELFDIPSNEYDRINITDNSIMLDGDSYYINRESGILNDCLESFNKANMESFINLSEASAIYRNLKNGMVCEVSLNGDIISQPNRKGKSLIK